MNSIWIIFKKEMKELFRDRKSLFTMIGFPILILPFLIAGGVEIGKRIAEKEEGSFMSFLCKIHSF